MWITQKHLLLLCLFSISGITPTILMAQATFREGRLLRPSSELISSERIQTVPFKDGVLVLDGEDVKSFVYYFTGEGPPELLVETGSYVNHLGSVPGGRVFSSSDGDVVQFLSEDDYSIVELGRHEASSTPRSVQLEDRIVQYSLSINEGLVISAIGGQLPERTELLRASVVNGQGGHIISGGRVVISTTSGLFLSDGTPAGTFQISNELLYPLHQVHFFNGEYFLWDFDLRQIIAVDPINGEVRRVMGPGFPTELIPNNPITEMALTDAGILYVASTNSIRRGLFLTDGTPQGSRLLREFPDIHGFFGSPPRSITSNAPHPTGLMVFLVNDGTNNVNEMWYSDGTEEGTKKIRDIPPDVRQYSPLGIARYDPNHSYFQNRITYDEQVIDQFQVAYPEGDSIVFEVLEEEGLTFNLTSIQYRSLNGWFYYTDSRNPEVNLRAYLPRENQRILFSDSVAPVLNEGLIQLGDLLFVPVENDNIGKEPGVFSLETETVTLLGDLMPGDEGSQPHFFRIGGVVYFLARDPDDGFGIYQTLGSNETTTFVTDLHDRLSQIKLKAIAMAGDLIMTGSTFQVSHVVDQDQNQISPIGKSLWAPRAAHANGYFSGSIVSIEQNKWYLATTDDLIDVDTLLMDHSNKSSFRSYDDNFAFLIAENDTVISFVLIDPATRNTRLVPLGGSTNSRTLSSYNSSAFSIANEFFFQATADDGSLPIYRYTNDEGLQLRLDIFPVGEKIKEVTVSQDGGHAIIQTASASGQRNHWLYDPAIQEFLLQPVQEPELLVSEFRRLDNQFLVRTPYQLYLTTSLTDISPDVNEILIDGAEERARLRYLTWVGEDKYFFLREPESLLELWQTDGTTEGTEIMFSVPGAHSIFNQTMPSIPGWLMVPTSGGEEDVLYLYNYNTGEQLQAPSTPVIGAAVSAGDRFYYITTTDDGRGTEVRYLEEALDSFAIGMVYHDINSNGIRDDGEPGVAHQQILTDRVSETLSSYSVEEGSYPRLYLPGETYSISILPDDCWRVTTDSTVTLTDMDSTPNFGLRSINDHSGLRTQLFSGPVRCGFDVPFWLVVTNTGCQDLSGATITLDPDAEVTFLGADSPPEENEGQLTWSNFDLPVGASLRIDMLLKMPDENRAGTIVPFTLSASATDEVGGIVIGENEYLPSLRCAIDPNDKLVFPARFESTESNYTQVDENLLYTIRFQNTGNDTALNVRLEDQLADGLDLSTFSPIAASHDYKVVLKESGKLMVYFNDIFLPDSTTNESESHGFFAFEIRANGRALDTKIKNTAGIFFDFNAPVITNTVSNTIVEYLDEDQDGFYFWDDCDDQNPDINPDAFDVGGNGVDENCDDRDATVSVTEAFSGDLNLFPNPTTRELYVLYSGAERLLLTVYDLRGKEVVRQFFRQSGFVDLSSVPTGVYLVRFTELQTGQEVTRVVIRQ